MMEKSDFKETINKITEYYDKFAKEMVQIAKDYGKHIEDLNKTKALYDEKKNEYEKELNKSWLLKHQDLLKSIISCIIALIPLISIIVICIIAIYFPEFRGLLADIFS